MDGDRDERKSYINCLHHSDFLQSQSFFLKRHSTKFEPHLLENMKAIVSVCRKLSRGQSRHTERNCSDSELIKCDFRFWRSLSCLPSVHGRKITRITNSSQLAQQRAIRNSRHSSISHSSTKAKLTTARQQHGFQSSNMTNNSPLMEVTKHSKIDRIH